VDQRPQDSFAHLFGVSLVELAGLRLVGNIRLDRHCVVVSTLNQSGNNRNDVTFNKKSKRNKVKIFQSKYDFN
jgi:hypothetical protein